MAAICFRRLMRARQLSHVRTTTVRTRPAATPPAAPVATVSHRSILVSGLPSVTASLSLRRLVDMALSPLGFLTLFRPVSTHQNPQRPVSRSTLGRFFRVRLVTRTARCRVAATDTPRSRQPPAGDVSRSRPHRCRALAVARQSLNRASQGLNATTSGDVRGLVGHPPPEWRRWYRSPSVSAGDHPKKPRTCLRKYTY